MNGQDASLMTLEMAEQPAVLRRFLARRSELHAQIARVTPRDLRGIALVGRGSSANAALFGRTLLELATSEPAMLVSPSIGRLYHARTDYKDFVAIGLSQSGETPEVVETIRALRAEGAVTIALTSQSDGLAEAADLWIDLDVGVERAVPTTKAFTAELAALVTISEALGEKPLDDHEWIRAADEIASVLNDPLPVAVLARRLEEITHLSVIAAGMFLGIAEEVALKLQETALVAASAHSAASYRHGPLALAGREHPVIAIVGSGDAGEETAEAVRDLRAQRVPVAVIGTDGEVDIPTDLPEQLAAIPAVVRGQQLALALAERKGLDPDRPPKLEKVTMT
ncbi:MAG: SIS domain-containing protein [Actinomycetota bacterium]